MYSYEQGRIKLLEKLGSSIPSMKAIVPRIRSMDTIELLPYIGPRFLSLQLSIVKMYENRVRVPGFFEFPTKSEGVLGYQSRLPIDEGLYKTDFLVQLALTDGKISIPRMEMTDRLGSVIVIRNFTKYHTVTPYYRNVSDHLAWGPSLPLVAVGLYWWPILSVSLPPDLPGKPKSRIN